MRRPGFLALATSTAVCLTQTVRSPLMAQQQPATLRAGTSTSDASKALYYAKTSGMFQKYGLSVDISIINSGTAGMAAIIGGTLDVVSTSLVGVCQAHLRGVPFQLIAPASLYSTERPAVLLLTRFDSSVRSGRDLTGKSLGSASLSDLYAAAAFAWVDQTGGDHRTVHNVEIPPTAILGALDTGRIDVATLGSPFLEQALASGKVRILAKSLDSIAPHFEVSGYVTSNDILEKQAGVMNRFAQAMHEAIRYTNTHLDQTVALVASYSGVDAAVIAKSIRIVDPEFLEARYIQPVIDVAAKAGLLDRRFDANEIIATAAVHRS